MNFILKILRNWARRPQSGDKCNFYNRKKLFKDMGRRFPISGQCVNVFLFWAGSWKQPFHGGPWMVCVEICLYLQAVSWQLQL